MAGFQVESDRIEQAEVAVAETLCVPSLKEQQIEALANETGFRHFHQLSNQGFETFRCAQMM